MAQLTITTTRSIVISGLPEGLTDAEQQEIARWVSLYTRFDEEELSKIAIDLDLAGDWTTVEQPVVGKVTIVETKEG